MTIGIQHACTEQAQRRLAYVVAFCDQHPLKPERWTFVMARTAEVDTTIGYGLPTGDWQIPAQQYFFGTAPQFDYFVNSYQWREKLLYSVEPHQVVKGPLIKDHTFQFDLFETLFFHISRYEEVFAREEDYNQAGWLLEEKQLLIRHQLQRIPVVDQLIQTFFEILSRKVIPCKTTFALSHDLDLLGRFTPPVKFVSSVAASLLKRQNPGEAGRSIAHYVKMLLRKVKDPYDSFPTLLRPESHWQSKTLYLMAGGETAYDNQYSLDDARLTNILKLAKQRGYNIGLHPSYNAGMKAELYEKEWEQLSERMGQPVKHNRQHWLRMDWQQTPYLWEANGIEADSTLGYSQHLGFRCGTGFPYQLYNFKAERAFGFIEQPFAFMDSAAVHVALREERDLEEVLREFWEQLPEATEVLFNFHNSTFDPLTETGRVFQQFYENCFLQGTAVPWKIDL